jgi:hypothetical protein
MERIVRAVLEGEDAVPGRVLAGDFAKLILGLQGALSRAAQTVLGRPRTATTGRYEAVIEAATRLRFVGVEEGSFVGVLALPEVPADADELGVDVTMQDLGYRACLRLVSELNDPASTTDPTLARAIAHLADEVNVGGRTSRIRLELAPGTRVARTAVIDEATRHRMHEIANRPQRRSNVLHGRLMEADFEKLSARLRLPTGERVNVTFEPHLADEIQAALREPGTFTGDVTYNRDTGVASSVELRTIATPRDQLELTGLDFRLHRSVAELATEQGFRGAQDLDNLRIEDIDDDELAAFVLAAERS